MIGARASFAQGSSGNATGDFLKLSFSVVIFPLINLSLTLLWFSGYNLIVKQSATLQAAGLYKLFSDDLNQDAFGPAAVKFSIEDLLPGPQIQLAVRHRHDHFAAHDLPLEVCIGIVFSAVVMPVLAYRSVGCLTFQPSFVV